MGSRSLRGSLSRHAVLDSALDLIDRVGLDGLTIRALGRELGKPPMSPSAASLPGDAKTWRFLVVDDDPAAVRGMTALLREDGYEVSPFTAGADAVEALARESFDAVMTDLEMPHVDGNEVVRAAREHHPHACVVVVTGHAGECDETLLEAGACVVSDKPLEYEELMRVLCDCRGGRGPGVRGRCHMRSRQHGDPCVPLRRK